MSYNKYNTRNSGRFNTPGHFVSGGDFRGAGPGGRTTYGDGQRGYQGGNYSNSYSQKQYQGEQQSQQQYQPEPHPQQQKQMSPPPPPPPLEELQVNDTDMKSEPVADSNADNDSDSGRPSWMKKFAGVRKISKKERRRRQNQTLRRLLSPKNAIMALNEMMPTEQVTNLFKIEGFAQQPNAGGFCADLTLKGQNYKGYGDNKMSARNAAAEQAIRDLITKQLGKVSQDVTTTGEDEDPLPMIQLASFALHKLFSEWEESGHRMPQLKPNSSNSVSDGGEAAPPVLPAPKPPRVLPLNAAQMHPSMLLTYMRPKLEWRDLAADGDRPQNMQFTMGVDVDGSTYIGKASNKKEARRLAAKAACEALFDVVFDAQASNNVPVTK